MNDRIKYQQKVADDVLSRLSVHDPFCIVAGGAPRDWYMGKEATDLDVFFYSTVSQAGIMHRVLEKIFPEAVFEQVGVDSDGKEFDENYRHNPNLRRVFQAVIGGETVQFMQMMYTTYLTVVPLFPFSICKAWYVPGEIRTDPSFDFTVKTKIILAQGDLYSDKGRYVAKIREKFPDYLFLDKEHSKSHAMKWALGEKDPFKAIRSLGYEISLSE